jgi:hypothetical protein
VNKTVIILILLLASFHLLSQNTIDTILILKNHSEHIDIYNPYRIYIKILSDTNNYKQILEVEKQKIFIELDSIVELPYEYKITLIYIDRVQSSKLLQKVTSDSTSQELLLPLSISPSTHIYGEKNDLITNGYISRGIMMSSKGQSSVQSSLDIQFYGEIAPFQIEGSLNDRNLPIQPEGTSARLQEIDRVYIALKKDKFNLTLGDFNIKSSENAYFSKYSRKLQGSMFTNISKTDKYTFNYGGALAMNKGKYDRVELQMIDGVSGPYKLRSTEANYLQVIAGSETVYLDGTLLQRGYDADYVIDYNTAEISFMPKLFIRSSMHIVIEFLYTDYNFAQSSYGIYTEISNDRWLWGINYFSEGDVKSQPLLLTLSDSDKVLLSNAGANLPVEIPAFNQTNYDKKKILYKMIDTLGYDSVFIYSTDSTAQLFEVSFTYLGQNKGNYKIANYAANGKIYEWVLPVNGKPQGEYEPIRIINAPKRTNTVESYIFFKPNEKIEARLRVGYSQKDRNTYSNIDSLHQGVAYKVQLITKPSMGHTFEVFSQGIQANFSSLEHIFTPEENRILNKDLFNNKKMEFLNGLKYIYNDKKSNSALLSTSFYNISKNEYSALASANAKFNWKNFNLFTNNDFSHTQLSEYRIDYFRSNSNLNGIIKSIWIGLNNKIEYHPIKKNDTIQNHSQQYYSIAPYIGWGDSSVTFIKIYYEYYNEQTPLKRDQQKAGYQLQLKQNIWNLKQNNYIVFQSSNNQEKNFFTSDNEINLNTRNKSLIMQLRYLLSQKQTPQIDYTFVEVPIGQGTHYWIDANNNGLQELNEFHLANFNDQAQYILLSVPTQKYISTYSQILNFNFRFSPSLINKLPQFIKNFNLQTFININQATKDFNFLTFNNNKIDSILSFNNMLRNVLAYHPKKTNFSVRYEYYKQKSLQTLIVGNIEQLKENHSLQIFIPISKKWNLQSQSDYLIEMNKSIFVQSTTYDYDQFSQKIELQHIAAKYQIRIAPRYAYIYNKDLKFNKLELALEPRFFSIKAGTLITKLAYLYNDAPKNMDPTMEYLMLEGYKSGSNGLIQIQWQKTLNQVIQISLQYEGRISQRTSMTHVGSINVRALL